MSSDDYKLPDKEVYCDWCKNIQIHSLDHLKSSTWTTEDQNTQGVDHYIAACIKCKFHCVYLRRQYSNADVDYETNEETGEVNGTYNYKDTYYQPLINGDSTDLHLHIREDERQFIPFGIQNLVNELQQARLAGIWTLWSIGVRAVLDASLIAKGVQGVDLESKIQSFIATTSAEQRNILEDFYKPLFDIHYFSGETVRTVPEEFRENIAGLLIALLTIAFILPGRMDEIAQRFTKKLNSSKSNPNTPVKQSTRPSAVVVVEESNATKTQEEVNNTISYNNEPSTVVETVQSDSSLTSEVDSFAQSPSPQHQQQEESDIYNNGPDDTTTQQTTEEQQQEQQSSGREVTEEYVAPVTEEISPIKKGNKTKKSEGKQERQKKNVTISLDQQGDYGGV